MRCQGIMAVFQRDIGHRILATIEALNHEEPETAESEEHLH